MRVHSSSWALLLALLAGCSNGGFDVPVTRTLAAQTIPGDPTAHALAQSDPTAVGDAGAFEYTSEQGTENTTGIAHVALASMQLTIENTDPAGSPCWDFVHTITVSIESTRNGTTLPRTAIATATDPGCQKDLTLTPIAGVNLQPYANEGFRIVTDGTGIPPATDVTFDGAYTLTLSVL